MRYLFWVMSMLVATLLAGCGSSDGVTTDGTIVRQFGVSEGELYDPVHKPNGILVGKGSGVVSLMLEPVGGPAAPLVGDTAGLGVDEVWFEATESGTVDLQLTDESLAVASRMEVSSAAGVLRLFVDKDHRQGKVELAPGRYVFRIYAAPLSTDIANVVLWFGGSSALLNSENLRRVIETRNCSGCDLRGANLSGVDLRSANLNEADLRGAILTRANPGGFSLDATAIFRVYLSGSDLAGADLSATNLNGAKLSGAVLTGAGRSGAILRSTNLNGADMSGLYLPRADLSAANLSKVNLSGAYLAGADLSSANLSLANLTGANLIAANLSASNLTGTILTGASFDGALWLDGHTCALNSTGVCR